MAQIAALLSGNLGFLLEARGEPLEPVGEGQKLITAARLKPHILGDSAQLLGDLAEVHRPFVRVVRVHRFDCLPHPPTP